MINLHRLIRSTRAEGPGKRVCVWFQGCSRRCRGCFAEDTWSFAPRTLMPAEAIAALLQQDKEIEGITVLGGEPFEQAEALAELLKLVKQQQKSTVVFTGFLIEELQNSGNVHHQNALACIDVLVDGAYEADQRSFDIPMIGSSNQRFHFLTDRYQMSDFRKNTIEIVIDQNGIIRVNGMGDFEKLKDHEVI